MRIFVSSASGHLKAYREAVVEVCRRYGHEPVYMEDFAPGNPPPAAYSAERVQECDGMVVLLGHRYGSLIPGETRSYTELEYDVASSTSGMRVMVWIVEDDFPWPPPDIEEGIAKERLAALKARAGAEHTIRRFGDPARFREDLAHVFHQLQLRGSEGASTPTAGITRHIPPAPEIAAFPKYVGSSPTFVGRDRELAWLDDWAVSTDSVAVVEAIGGTGKSALTWDWFTRRAPEIVQDLAGRFWWSFYDDANSLRKFQESLLVYTSGVSLAAAAALDTEELVQQVLAALDEAPFLVVMDGIERLLNAYHRLHAGMVTDAQVAELEQDDVQIVYARGLTDPGAVGFFQRLAQSRRSRILASSRLLPDAFLAWGGVLLPGVRHLILPGLRTRDTRLLLARLGVKHGYAEIKTFFDHLDNHPLLIGIVAGLVKTYRRAPGDFDAWFADPERGGKFSLAGLSITERSHDILEQALAGLDPVTLQLLQRIAVPGAVTTWDMVKAINPFLPRNAIPPAEWATLPQYLAAFLEERRTRQGGDLEAMMTLALTKLDAALKDLEDRGLLWWNQESNTYDLHPVVRAYAYERTEAQERRLTNSALVDHFGRMRAEENPEAATSVADLVKTIALFRALLGMGALVPAEALWVQVLSLPLVHRWRSNLVVIPLLTEAVRLAEASGANSNLEWDLAIAEAAVGRLDSALERHRNLVARCLSNPRLANRVLSGLNNLIGEGSLPLGHSAEAGRYIELLEALTKADGSAPEAVARVRLWRAFRLLRAERGPELLALVDESLAGPALSSSPNWRGMILALRANTWVLLGEIDKLEPLEVSRYPFGQFLDSRRDWASLIFDIAVQQGDYALAHEAAVAGDYWRRRMGAESIPADVAWCLAEMGRDEEATDLINDTLRRFDRVHPALRPNLDAARALKTLGRLDEAKAYGLAAYKQAWEDGPPTQGSKEVRQAREFLDEIGIVPPTLPSIDPATYKAPLEPELRAYIEQVRQTSAERQGEGA